MSRTRILCLGDLHLGLLPSRLPAEVIDSPEERRKASTAAVWLRAVEAAIDRRVGLVLLSGDVVDRDNRYFEAFGSARGGVGSAGGGRNPGLCRRRQPRCGGPGAARCRGDRGSPPPARSRRPLGALHPDRRTIRPAAAPRGRLVLPTARRHRGPDRHLRPRPPGRRRAGARPAPRRARPGPLHQRSAHPRRPRAAGGRRLAARPPPRTATDRSRRRPLGALSRLAPAPRPDGDRRPRRLDGRRRARAPGRARAARPGDGALRDDSGRPDRRGDGWRRRGTRSPARFAMRWGTWTDRATRRG